MKITKDEFNRFCIFIELNSSNQNTLRRRYKILLFNNEVIFSLQKYYPKSNSLWTPIEGWHNDTESSPQVLPIEAIKAAVHLLKYNIIK